MAQGAIAMGCALPANIPLSAPTTTSLGQAADGGCDRRDHGRGPNPKPPFAGRVRPLLPRWEKIGMRGNSWWQHASARPLGSL